MIHMPPRHGKSVFTSQYFPGWWLGTFPRDQVILTSYEAGFAAEWGGKVRDSIDEFGPDVFNIRLREDSTARNRWNIVDRQTGRPTEGGMRTAGVGGGITGRGANLFIMDDPIKDFRQANSRTYRDLTWDWWQSTAMTRVEPDGVVILMMTRWHEDDLAGRILRETPQDWVVLSLPALADEDETILDPTTREVIWRRKKHDPLWPRRWPKAILENRRAKMSSYWWHAVYQQKPRPPEGVLFKRSWFRYFEIEQDGAETYYALYEDPTALRPTRRWRAADCWRFQTCDPAATEDELSDYFVLATWVVTPHKELLLIDVLREHAETVKHQEILGNSRQRWNPAFQGVEKATFGLNIIQAAKRQGLPIKPLPAEGDKVARARTIATRYETGMVYHRKGAPWLTVWEDEHLDFPHGEKDDQVDVSAYAGIVIAQDIGIDEEGEVKVEVL